jgi:hypothetical protein
VGYAESEKSNHNRPMQFAILRIEKRKGMAWKAMARHALRDGGPPVRNADPALRDRNTVLRGPSTAAETIAQIDATLPQKRRKDAVEVVELLVTGSPEALAAMAQSDQDAYFARSMRWIEARFGAKNVRLAVVHRDETTPHLQVLLTPIDPKTGQLVANKYIGGPSGLRQMQTDFAEKVGQKFGLVRGLERLPGQERVKHTTMRSYYAAIAATRRVDLLPPRVEIPAVPDLPTKPRIFASTAAKTAYQDALKTHQEAVRARKTAAVAQRARQVEIERLAAVGVAVHGHQARAAGEKLVRARNAEQRSSKGLEVVARLRRDRDQLKSELGELHDELASVASDIERRREALETDALEARHEQLEQDVLELQAVLEELLDQQRPQG